jgi:cytochrome c-type biogenesis protein CcmE
MGAFSLGIILFVMLALKENVLYFVTPTELLASPSAKKYRLGGLVEQQSLVRDSQTLSISFRVTDLNTSLKVTYQGVTPDLFQEGQGVVVEGSLQGEAFVATRILAKHDEQYRPRKFR